MGEGTTLEGAEVQSASPSPRGCGYLLRCPASYLLARLSICIELRFLTVKNDVYSP